ncbi:hypothetical protein [Pradoshia sp.]
MAKHDKRNQGLPEQRLLLMKAIESDLLKDQHITGIFYGGSIGNESTDLFSDIDLRIVVKDEKFEPYRLSKKERCTRWGNVLFYEDRPWTAHTVAHFDTFLKVDTFYYKKREVHPSVYLQDIKIVHDPNGYLMKVKNQSIHLSYYPSEEEVVAWRSKFLAFIHETYRSLMRREYFSALHYLDGLRLSAVMGWYMAAGYQPNAFGDWSKIDGERSKLTESQKYLLRQWHANQDAEDIMKVVKALIPELLAIHQSLCVQLDIKTETAKIEDILNMVL